MAQSGPPILNREERGGALIVVLVALAALMPIAMILSDLVLMRQRQVTGFQQNMGGQAAVRGALDVARSRLRSREIALGQAQSAEFELTTSPRPVRVRVTREPDAILALDGSVIDADEAAELDLDLDRVVGDFATGGGVHQYRRLEVYLVEAECSARYPVAALRLLAVVGRLDEGVISLGLRYDRGYFP